MNKIVCPKCGGAVSNDFGHTLSFCTSCGGALSNPAGDETRLLTNKTTTTPARSRNSNLSTILLTSFATAAFLTVMFAGALYIYFARADRQAPISDAAQPALTPKTDASRTPRKKSASPVSAAEITSVEFSAFEYLSPRANYPSGIQANRTTAYSNHSTTKTVFAADGTALKSSTVVTYDAENKKSERTTRLEGTPAKEQFVRLAEVLVENDFLNEPDSREIITDSNSYALKITYVGGEKKIATSNVGRDTLETAAILRAFRELQNRVEWKTAK